MPETTLGEEPTEVRAGSSVFWGDGEGLLYAYGRLGGSRREHEAGLDGEECTAPSTGSAPLHCPGRLLTRGEAEGSRARARGKRWPADGRGVCAAGGRSRELTHVVRLPRWQSPGQIRGS